MINRRQIVASGIGAALVPSAAYGMSAGEGFAIDWQSGPETPAVVASLSAQIALVKALKIKPERAAFFASQPITVDLANGTKTRAGPRGIFFERRAVPADNPVLLHELLHRYQLLRLPGGVANPTVHAFYDAAKTSGLYPAKAYMLSNAFEFYAMMASTVLYGRTSRPPLLRANVARKSPDMFAWIVEDFGLVA